MEVTTVVTIWTMFSCMLLFPMLGLPRAMSRAALLLAYAEMIAFLMWSFGSQGCAERPCGTIAETGRTAAAIDVPLLSAGLLALAIIRGVRGRRHGQRLSS